jgi:hypothetical protein
LNFELGDQLYINSRDIKWIMMYHKNLALFGGNVEKEPRSFDDAWNCKDSVNREKWRMAINKEFNNIESGEVWDIIRKEEVPRGRRFIKCRWICKIKLNGIFRRHISSLWTQSSPWCGFK